MCKAEDHHLALPQPYKCWAGVAVFYKKKKARAMFYRSRYMRWEGVPLRVHAEAFLPCEVPAIVRIWYEFI